MIEVEKEVDHQHGKRDFIIVDIDYKTKAKWYLTCILGFQHFLTMCTPNAIASLLLINSLCLDNNSPIKSELISTSFFVMGIATLLQTIFGVRLPIIQGATYSILIPTISLMNMPDINMCNISENIFVKNHLTNETLPQSTFHLKIRLINGALMVTSLVEILMAVSGLLGVLIRLVSPLSLAAIYTVLSLSICDSLINMISEQWLVGITSIIIMVILTTVLAPKAIPIPVWTKKNGWKFMGIKIFQISPVIMGLLIIWIICTILTISGAFSKNPKGWGHTARTDIRLKVIHETPIIRIPYPFQWGSPLVIPSAIIGMSAGIIVSIIESLGDYMLTAEVCQAPKVPRFAINRGILMEGISVFLSGFLGAAVGPTSYSDNIGLMRITNAGNISIARVAALIMLVCGIFPIISAIFVSIPNPIIGGIVFIVTLMIMGCGISNLRFVDLNSTRNTLIFGLAVALGIFIPVWTKKNLGVLETGYKLFDEIIQIILSINLFIAAVISIILDNVLPGSYSNQADIEIKEEVIKESSVNCTDLEVCEIYDTTMLKWLATRFVCLQYLPVFPAYRKLLLKEKIKSKSETIVISTF